MSTTNNIPPLRQSLEERFDEHTQAIMLDQAFGPTASKLLSLLNMAQLTVSQATLDPPKGTTPVNQTGVVKGTTTFWDVDGVDITITFTESAQEQAIAVAAIVPHLSLVALGSHLVPLDPSRIVGLTSISFEQVHIDANTHDGQVVVTGNLSQVWSLPGMDGIAIANPLLHILIRTNQNRINQYRIDLRGTIKLKTIEIPVAIDLPLGIRGWKIHLLPPGISLPSLTDLLDLLSGVDVAASLPQEVQSMPAFTLSTLTISFDPTIPAWLDTDFTLVSSNSWQLAPQLSIEQVRLTGSLRPAAPSAQRGAAFYSGAISGMARIGTMQLAVTIPIPFSGPLLLEASPNLMLPGVGDLALLVDADLATVLPHDIHAVGSITLDYLQVQLDLSTRRLVSFQCQLFSPQPWVLIPDHLSLENLTIFLQTGSAQGQASINCLAAGAILVEETRIAVALERSGATGAWSLWLADTFVVPGIRQLAHLLGGDEVERFLPAELTDNLGTLMLYDFAVQFTSARTLSSVSLGVKSAEGWTFLPGYLVLSKFDLSLLIGQPLDSAHRQISGSLVGIVDLDGIIIEMQGTKVTGDAPWQFNGALTPGETVNLLSIVTSLLPDGLALPDELPDIDFSDLSISVTPSTGTFALQGKSTITWDLPFGVPGLSVSTVDIALSREPVPGTGSQPQQGKISCSLTLNVTGPVTVVEGLVFQGMQLTFALDQAQQSWSLMGSVAAALFDHPFTLGASLQTTSAVRTFMLQATYASNEPVVHLPNWSLSASALSITISKALQSIGATGTSATGAVSLNSSAYTWSVNMKGGITVTDVDELSFKGMLSLQKGTNSFSLVFQPDIAEVGILIRPLMSLTAHLGLDYLSIIRTTEDDGKHAWAIDATIDSWFSGLPDKPQILQQIVPAKNKRVKGSLKVDKNGAVVAVSSLVPLVPFTVPATTLGSRTLDLGTGAIEVPSMQLTLGKNLALSADFGIGLPDKMNDIFATKVSPNGGTNTPDFFVTYQPLPQNATQNSSQAMTQNPTITRFRLGVTSTGLQVQMRSSPIKKLQATPTGNDQTACVADMGEFGAISFTLPVLSFSTGNFSCAGSFQQIQGRELRLPLIPLKLLFQACHLDALANKIPRSIPISKVDVYDKASGTFNGQRLVDLLNSLGQELVGPSFTLGSTVEQGLRELENRLDRLPDSFKDYLDIELPEAFSFSIALSETGSFRCNVQVGQAAQTAPTVQPLQPIKILYPAMGPLGPQLNGLSLYGFSIGEMLDGALIPITINMRLHQFNLLTLLAALALPLDKLPILPSTQQINTALIIENLFMVIVYEDVIPIPLPLFFDELGLDYLGLEGLALQTHWRFPKPKLSMGDAAKIFSDFEKFFTDRSYLLDASTPPQNMDLVLTIGPNYIQLPKYLGSQMLGSKDDKIVVSSYTSLAHLLNALKTLSLNEIVQALPPDKRVGKQQVSFACMTLEADWLITTPAEFRTISYKQLNIVDSAIDTMLQVVPPTPRQDEQGLVLFLKGVWSVANIASLEACFGLIGTVEGFSTGMRVSGSLTDLLAVEMRGIVVINPHAANAFSLSGHSRLVVLGDDIFIGDLKLTENRFAIEGDLNLFPKWPTLRITGHLTGQLSETELYIAGSAAVTVGGYFTLASASAEVTHTGIKIAGTWLQQTVTFVAQKINSTVQLQAMLSPITLGEVFKITGAGTEPGPRATLGVSANNVSSLFLGGKIALLGVQVEGQVSFTEQGFSFVISGQIFSLFQATLTATGGDLLNGETFTITATMQNDLLEYLREHITTEIKAAADAATAHITADQDQVRQAQDRVNSLNSQIDAMRQTIQGERDRDAQRLRDAQQAVNNAQNQVNSLQSQVDYYNWQIDARKRDIADKQSWYDNSPWYEKTYRWAELSAYGSQKGAEITGLGTALGGLYTAKAGADATLRATEATLQGLEQTAQTAPIDLDPRMTGLYAARETASGTLELANKTLDAAKAAAGAWADVSAFIAKYTLGGLVNVTAASFTGQLNAVQGGNVTMKADLQLMNRPHTYTFSFAFHDPLSSVKALAQTVINDIANMPHS